MFMSSKTTRLPFGGSGPTGECVNSRTKIPAIVVWHATWSPSATMIAAISDAVTPVARPAAVGVYRFWRDMGYVVGGLAAGILADSIDYSGAIGVIAAVTAASGVFVAVDRPGWRATPIPASR
jgi:predicted MFS family arabinose efflux permease